MPLGKIPRSSRCIGEPGKAGRQSAPLSVQSTSIGDCYPPTGVVLYRTNGYSPVVLTPRSSAACNPTPRLTMMELEQQNLPALEQRLRAVLDAIPDIVVVLDAGGRYRDIYTGDVDL